MITIDGGTGVILHNGADVAAPKMVDSWRLNVDLTNSDSDATAKQGTSSLFLDVTNTSNVKVRFKPTSIASGSRITYQHDTATYDTVVNFIKMGLT